MTAVGVDLGWVVNPHEKQLLSPNQRRSTPVVRFLKRPSILKPCRLAVSTSGPAAGKMLAPKSSGPFKGGCMKDDFIIARRPVLSLAVAAYSIRLLFDCALSLGVY
jgi:hypothetical protein